ncbi:unnamed protein product, partial [marine sediment metagenome]
KAAVQIIHGLMEHAKRYTRLAEALCKEGYICYANDHPGHGLTAGDLTEATLKGNGAVLGPSGWRGVVNDVHELSNIIKKENPNIPLFVIGHSWGAMLAQDYIQDWGNEIKGCILSGTNGKVRSLVIKAGKILITGPPRCGKSTLISKLIEYYNNKKDYTIYGFLTPEIRERGNRIGFNIVDIYS